jgi:glycosyltransferase involved in cell wall biosynthesis
MKTDLRVQITAVIPVRSMAGRLENLKQTLRSCAGLPLQVVIVHDDAGDGTETDLNDLLDGLYKVNVEKFNVQYASPGLARNLGIRRAEAEWICFWDCDDLPNPSAYISLLNSINSKEFDVLIGSIATQSGVDTSTRKLHPTLVVNKSIQMQLANMPAFTRMIFRKSLIENHVFPSFKIGEDQCFLREIEFLNSRVHFSKDLLYTYISDYDGQLSRDQSLKVEIISSLEFLADALWSSPTRMQVFCQTQFIKIFVSSCRSLGVVRFVGLTPKSLKAMLKLTAKNPIGVLRVFYFLAKSRPRLAGRDS